MATNWAMAVVILAAMMLLGGILLMWIGYRGRRVDDHPICRTCGYDLFGRPEGSQRCSECGAELNEAKAIRIGRRQPMRVMMVAGMLMLAVGGVMVGVAVNAARGGFDPNQYKPMWWLLSDTNSASPATRDAALAEINGRLRAGRVSDGNVRKLVDRALDVQGDLNKPWVGGWGDIVEWAHTAGKLPAEKWQRYVKQAAVFVLSTRPKVRKGAAVPVKLANSPRLGKGGQIWVQYEGRYVEVSGKECNRQAGRSGGSTSLTAGSSSSGSWALPGSDEGLKEIAAGPQTLRMSMDVAIFDSQPPGWTTGSKAQPVVKTKLDLRTNFQIVDEETVKIVKDPTLREQVEKSLKVKLQPSYGLRAQIDAASPPVSLAYDLVARVGPTEWKIGSVAFVAGKGAGWSTGGDVKGFDAGKCDLILRPSKDMAESQVDIDQMWDGEVVFKDVPVERSR